jgi:hypothetical protein
MGNPDSKSHNAIVGTRGENIVRSSHPDTSCPLSSRVPSGENAMLVVGREVFLHSLRRAAVEPSNSTIQNSANLDDPMTVLSSPDTANVNGPLSGTSYERTVSPVDAPRTTMCPWSSSA